MGYVIHTRKRATDTKFRIWCTVTDSYVTVELDEKELREMELKMRLEHTIAEYFREIDSRIERAVRNGTSVRHTTRQNLVWDIERI